METTIDRDRELLGTVVAVQANFYRVRLDKKDGEEEILLLCTRRARLKKIGQKVMVGDRVIVVEGDDRDSRGAIAGVLERQSELERPPIANADLILLLFSLAEPSLDPWQLSRFLVKAESTGLEICLCLNKIDLVDGEVREIWRDRLQKWGYNPIFIGAKDNLGLGELRDILQNKIAIVMGASGVGKSSTIERLIPNLSLRIGNVSGKLQKGRHTTRHVELFALPEGGFLADSPGFNQPDFSCTPAEIGFYFPEARERLQWGEAEGNSCQFANCSHREEPNCIVRGDWERYEHYLCFLEEAISKQDILQQRGDTESSVKLKIKGAGKEEYEPKLATKKYRRPSRRGDKQILQDRIRARSWEDSEEE